MSVMARRRGAIRPKTTAGNLFNDGFESETSSFNTNWNGKTEAGSSTVGLETSAPLTGSQSLKYTHTSAGTAYITKTITAASGYYAQFRVKVQTLVNGVAFSNFTIFQGRGPLTANISIGHDGTPANGLRIVLAGPSTSYVGSVVFAQGSVITIEVRYLPGASSNGGNQLWINGSLVYTKLDVTTSQTLDSFRMGAAALNANGLGTGTVLLFDDVKFGTAPIG